MGWHYEVMDKATQTPIEAKLGKIQTRYSDRYIAEVSTRKRKQIGRQWRAALAKFQAELYDGEMTLDTARMINRIRELIGQIEGI